MTFRTPADSGPYDFTALGVDRHELDIVLFKDFSKPIARLRGQRLFVEFKVAECLLRHARPARQFYLGPPEQRSAGTYEISRQQSRHAAQRPAPLADVNYYVIYVFLLFTYVFFGVFKDVAHIESSSRSLQHRGLQGLRMTS